MERRSYLLLVRLHKEKDFIGHRFGTLFVYCIYKDVIERDRGKEMEGN